MINILRSLILKVKELSNKLGLIADYVVEQGTSGVFSWEKWNGGKLVLNIQDKKTLDYTIVNGNYYRHADCVEYSFPVTFVTTPMVKTLNIRALSFPAFLEVYYVNSDEDLKSAISIWINFHELANNIATNINISLEGK